MKYSYSHFFVYLLVALLPIKAFASTNMLICNSMMQYTQAQQMVDAMPCHQEAVSEELADTHTEHQNSASYQSICASVCANACAFTAIGFDIPTTFTTDASQAIDFNQLSYRSVTLPSLQRPPITFI
ncbi:MAG: hypothetical protein B7X95_01780 [Methylophilaceae bacterium 17-44-8]|jgi:hypothetical protein|nr:MAG: hypothetical protein B7X95_01780 [Methylophilaceae bacterium 17-44-8]